MKLARRSFFKAAAGAAVAGPKAVEAVAREIDEKAFGYYDPTMGGFYTGPGRAKTDDQIKRRLKWCRDRLLEINTSGPTPRVDHVTRLDADLVANRSMSLDARMRIQARRNAIREHVNEVSHLERTIAKLLTGDEE